MVRDWVPTTGWSLMVGQPLANVLEAFGRRCRNMVGELRLRTGTWEGRGAYGRRQPFATTHTNKLTAIQMQAKNKPHVS